MTRVRPSDMAFPLRERGYEVGVSSYWSAAGEKTSVVQWVNVLPDNLQPFSRGLNANKLSDTSDELVKAASRVLGISVA